MNLLQKSYRAQRYETMDLRKMCSNSIDAFDPLSFRNRKSPHEKRYLHGDDGTLHLIEELAELDMKAFRRAIDLYLWAELTVGNLCHPRDATQHPHAM